MKQANNFNDSGGGANQFTLQGSFPTLSVVQCVTVSGRVYQDRNLDNTYTTGTGAFLNSDVPKAWTVKLFGKNVGAPTSSYALVDTKTSGAPNSSDPGKYTFTQVSGLRDYKICVTAAGADASSKWGLQSPTDNTECAPISTGGPSTAANRLPSLSANATDQDFQVVPVVGPFGTQTGPSTVGGYTVDASSNSTKPNDFYVQDTWVDSNGGTNFRFSPITACAPNCPAGTIFLLETLTADIDLDDLDGQQASLSYDDAAPFLDADLKPMPYCSIDPRQSGGNLATSRRPARHGHVLHRHGHADRRRGWQRPRRVPGVHGVRRRPADRLGQRSEALGEAIGLVERLACLRVLTARGEQTGEHPQRLLLLVEEALTLRNGDRELRLLQCAHRVIGLGERDGSHPREVCCEGRRLEPQRPLGFLEGLERMLCLPSLRVRLREVDPCLEGEGGGAEGDGFLDDAREIVDRGIEVPAHDCETSKLRLGETGSLLPRWPHEECAGRRPAPPPPHPGRLG